MFTNNKIKQCLIFLIIIIMCLWALFFNNINLKDQNHLKLQFSTSYPINISQVQPIVQSKSTKMKTILYWGTFFSYVDWRFGFGSEIFNNCDVQNCFTTNNKSLLPIDKFDAILFHAARFSVKKDGLPQKRSQHQKYVFYTLESYYNTFFESKCNKNFYNWTMTYKRDSDLFHPYGRLVKNNTGYQLPTSEDFKSKKKQVAWFVSNCRSKHRLRYVKELQKHIAVDIYGHCGQFKCPRSDDCYKMLEKNYKFYLSFENSFCEDYVTEKVYSVLKYNIVPIVYSFVDYDAFFPKNTLINTVKFINPKHLANYLQDLGSNETEYIKYFEWKKWYTVRDDYNLCDLCKKLHEPLEYSSYDDVKDWYLGYECVN